MRAQIRRRPLTLDLPGWLRAVRWHEWLLLGVLLALSDRHKQVRSEARELKQLLARAGGAPWWQQPRAPAWVRDNRASLAILDEKLHNRHRLTENLRLALTPLRLQ